jgi:D-ribose pyranose/furanose isomerase RbsD
MRLFIFCVIAALTLQFCCPQIDSGKAEYSPDWKEIFAEQLQLLGHRNWVLVVDKAFPAQTATGIEVVNSGENLLPALGFVLSEIEKATHVKPVIYTDHELSYITAEQVPVIDEYRTGLNDLLSGYEIQTILHDTVFVKIDQASKLFKVLVIKTEEVMPYSSVFIELDCRYWSPEQEKVLRERIGRH